MHNSTFRESVSNHHILCAMAKAHGYIFPHLQQWKENTVTSAQKMIPMSDDALYQFQMVAQLMQKEKIIKSQPLIKHKESNHTI